MQKKKNLKLVVAIVCLVVIWQKEYGSVELISSVTSDVLHKQQEFSSVAATKSVHKNMFLSEILPLLLQMHKKKKAPS